MSGPSVERFGYLGHVIGALLIFVGFFAGTMMMTSSITDHGDRFAFSEVGSSGWIDIRETGEHAIYAVSPDRPGSRHSTHAHVGVTDPFGETVPTAPYFGSHPTTRVESPMGRRRTAVIVATFDADAVGRYRVDANGVASDTTLGLGTATDDGVLLFALGLYGGGALMFVGAVVVAVKFFRDHRRSMKMARASTSCPGHPNPAPGSLAPPSTPVRPLSGSPRYPPSTLVGRSPAGASPPAGTVAPPGPADRPWGSPRPAPAADSGGSGPPSPDARL